MSQDCNVEFSPDLSHYVCLAMADFAAGDSLANDPEAATAEVTGAMGAQLVSRGRRGAVVVMSGEVDGYIPAALAISAPGAGGVFGLCHLQIRSSRGDRLPLALGAVLHRIYRSLPSPSRRAGEDA